MNIVYRNDIYLLIDLDYKRSGFTHNYLLFVNDNNIRKAYSVQMAVNYINKLPTATFDQTIDEQTFVACIPMSEYPEVKEYLENNCQPLDLFALADNQANRMIHHISKLLDGYNDVTDKKLNSLCEKLSQFLILLDLKKISHPPSVQIFDELYHTYLNKQRVFKYSLKHKIQLTKLKGDIELLLRKSVLQLNERPILYQLSQELSKLNEDIAKYNYQWYNQVKTSIDDLTIRINYKFAN